MHAPHEPGVTRREFLATATGVVGLSLYGVSSNALDAGRTSLATTDLTGTNSVAPVRVALITDMHGPHNWIDTDHLTSRVQAFRPDLICIVGDAVDRRGDEPLVGAYAAMTAPLGKFATLGNWEYQGECDLRVLTREYERAGVRLMVNERLRLNRPDGPLDLVGLDDWRAGTPDYSLVARLPAAEPGGPRALVLSHCPVGFDAVVRVAPRSTVVLSGHTHGGQIAPFGVALVLPEGSGRYVSGAYTAGPHTLYVSRGLGNSGPPFRVGARPELALLTI
jgi:predicted MPP superfamily phosphohydrolase